MNTILTDNLDLINKIEEKVSNIKHKDKEADDKLSKKISELSISDKQIKILKEIAKSRTNQLCIILRAKIVLMYILTPNKSYIARELCTYWIKVNTWVNRFFSQKEILDKSEKDTPYKLRQDIIETLSDKKRSGRPKEFTSLQIGSIIFVSLQSPEIFNVPISHWSAKLLRETVINLEIVDSISVRQVSRFLEEMDINVYRYQGWLNSQEKNPDFEQFKAKIREITNIYEKSQELRETGTVVSCIDEKMSIQALEHKHEKKPVQIGSLEKVEQEYKRNGTTGIIATRDVDTGKILVADVQPTRNEQDFVSHVKQVVETNSVVKRILIMDQLNTHMSESLVKYIAQECGIDIDLGTKGTCGILKSKETRKKFLEDKSHKIRIVYTPKHTSWMNQIEIWFGILSRQLLNKRSSFKSVEEMEEKIKEYISYYNKNLAKMFKWNTGKILQA